MKVRDVHRRLADIEACKGDDECARGMERDLWRDVLRSIATSQGEASPAALARAALQSQDIDFARWMA